MDPFSLLGGAAGAGDALKQLLATRFKQQLDQQKLALDQQTEQGTQDYRNKDLAERAAGRQATEAQTASQNSFNNQLRRDQLAQALQLGQSNQAGEMARSQASIAAANTRAQEGNLNRLSLAKLTASLKPPAQEPLVPVQQDDGSTIYLPRSQAVGQKKPSAGLSGATAENLASLNTADVEGTKILHALKDTGLDQSNDPADPRWEKFVVTTLKMAPGDYQKADIQQRTAFVQAALLRNLMGGRPSQYIAQMIQQHLPNGSMSGQQLSHVLNNVLQQTTERRAETENITRVPKGSLKPASGESYEDFTKATAAAKKPTAQDLINKYGGG